MNYLLRTLTENSAKSSPASPELRLLLSTVKDGRRQSTEGKLSDPFYESLEGLLLDLRTVTIDNHDAEAFLKPVTKSEVPDYYDIISNPMDLQTMMKKVKQKTYKSKREFKDDLDLIWNNCSTYNSAENHPLRLCARRLKAKAEKLLQSITDRKERIEPPIASVLPPTPGLKFKINGTANGHSHKRTLSASSSNGSSKEDRKRPLYVAKRQLAPRSSSFAESLAIIRTPAGMVEFNELDSQIESAFGDPTTLSSKLREFAPDDHESDEEPTSNVQTGEKRKMDGIMPPRKRVKYESPIKGDDLCQLWWTAVQSDELFGNGMPGIPYGIASKRTNKRKKRKKPSSPLPSKALLNMMHANIRTLRRIRRTHAKYAALNLASSGNKEDDIEGELPPPPPPVLAEGEDDIEDNIDERPWEPVGSGIEIGERQADSCLKWANGKILEHAGFQGTSSQALDVLSGVASEYLLNIGKTLKFLTEKCRSTMTTEEIILHTLFESGSKIQDLERYITDDIERYGTRLGDLEKKLVGAYAEATAVDSLNDEELFEEDEEDGGDLVMGNFADAIGDDFFGLRELGIAAEFGLSSLTIPKRLLRGKRAGAKQSSEQKRREPVVPYPPPPPFIPLSSDRIEDQIGLLQPFYRLRLASLVPPPIPALPPVPVPPLAPPSAPTSESTPNPTTTATPAPAPTSTPVPEPEAQAEPAAEPQPIIIPDDTTAPPGFTKLGPLGQVLKGSQTQAAKKKAKMAMNPTPNVPSTTPNAAPSPNPNADTPGGGGGAAEEGGKKAKKTTTGVGSGNGKKKKSNQDLSSQSQSQPGANVLPPVVAASA